MIDKTLELEAIKRKISHELDVCILIMEQESVFSSEDMFKHFYGKLSILNELQEFILDLQR